MSTDLTSPSLTDAPEHVQLAVDLIYLLESNNIAPQTALAALNIVRNDLTQKCQLQNQQQQLDNQ